MARNSHKSAYHGALLMGLKTIYIYPEIVGGYPQDPEKMGINGAVLPGDVEKALEKHPEIQAVFVTSPTYDGIVSDIRTIAEIVHRHGLPLIVDAAHGAHFPFSEHFPEDAVICGADVVIHSVHKTLPSLTQTALIHLNGKRIDRERIRKYLTVYQSSSPSYVLMAGIDQCMEWVRRNPEAFEVFWQDLQEMRKKLRRMKHLQLLEIPGMDESKVLVSVGDTGISGCELGKILGEEFHIELEMACAAYVCAITSVGDTGESLQRFADAFLQVDERLHGQGEKGKSVFPAAISDRVIPAESVCTIQEAEAEKKGSCPLEESVGRISGDFITLYPPGIPILAPGEIMSREILEKICGYLAAGFEVHGVQEGCICVLKREK